MGSSSSETTKYHHDLITPLMKVDDDRDHKDDSSSDAGVYALHLSTLATLPRVLRASIELGLFDIISAADHGGFLISASEIASKLPNNNNPDAASMLDRMLRLLASYSLLRCSTSHPAPGGGDDGTMVERRYGLAPAGKFFVNSNKADEGSLAAVVLLASHPATSEAWYHMKDLVLEGGNLHQKVHGMTLFQQMSKDPAYNAVFNTAMADFTVMTMKKLLKAYKGFEEISSLVDVGGGTGASINMIVSKYPSIKGINFDLPHVVKNAPSYQGIEHVGGDMFVSVPKADTIMIKCTLHNWKDDQCLTILKNCHEALPQEGKLIVIDFVLPVEPDGTSADKHTTGLDNGMLVNQSGRERTIKELEFLCYNSGFAKFNFVCFAYTMGVMEFHK